MTLEEINKYIDVSRRVYEFDKTLENLTINWATDPADMPFQNLAGCEMLKYAGKFLRMDKIKIDPKPELNLFYGMADSMRFVNLIELMTSGSKIIPPIYTVDVSYIDGVRMEKEADLFDGQHRMRMAEFLGFTEIPIVVMERISSYIFTLNKWKFSSKRITDENPNGGIITRDVIEATSIEGESIILDSGKGRPSIDDGCNVFPKSIKINMNI